MPRKALMKKSKRDGQGAEAGEFPEPGALAFGS
jgi:hypothetical protein